MTRLINQLMNDEAVYRTAPATPGLLNIEEEKCIDEQKEDIEESENAEDMEGREQHHLIHQSAVTALSGLAPEAG